ncbi:hypothetical protein TNCV_3315341 [Trichonephila clavipes]|nr:hypothetical protein TNCV_3315341 [Trichonephila clavipes]
MRDGGLNGLRSKWKRVLPVSDVIELLRLEGTYTLLFLIQETSAFQSFMAKSGTAGGNWVVAPTTLRLHVAYDTLVAWYPAEFYNKTLAVQSTRNVDHTMTAIVVASKLVSLDAGVNEWKRMVGEHCLRLSKGHFVVHPVQWLAKLTAVCRRVWVRIPEKAWVFVNVECLRDKGRRGASPLVRLGKRGGPPSKLGWNRAKSYCHL